MTTVPRSEPGWTPNDGETMRNDDGWADRHQTWDAAGIARLMAALNDAGVTYLRLEILSAGLNLEVRRGETGETVAPSPASPPTSDTTAEAAVPPADDLVTAPLLGLFYRRAAPDQPPFAEVGGRVEANQPIGVIEVMKTYHEVRAPRAGVIEAFLVEDEAPVQYGEPIARLAPAG